MEIEVVGRSDPGSVFGVKAILGDKALLVSYGTKPEWALFDNIRTGTIGAAIPPGWTIVPEMSCYVWVHLDAQHRIVNTVVPQGTILDLSKQIRDNWPSMWTELLQNNLHNNQVWQAVANTAKQRLHDRQAEAAIDRLLQSVTDSQRRVADINTRLKKALEDAASASSAVSILRGLQGVLTVADLASQAAEMLKAAPTTFSSASTGAAVVQKADEIRGDREQFAVRLQAQFDGSRDDLQTFLNRLWEQVKPANPPVQLNREFDVKITPRP
jgi:hypothetical protein